MLFKEIVYSDTHNKQIITLCGQNEDILYKNVVDIVATGLY
jgi:hypothetical protein